MTSRQTSVGTFLREPQHVIAVLRVLILAGLAMLGLAAPPAHPFLYWLLTSVYGATILGYLYARNRAYDLTRIKPLVFLFDVALVSTLIVLRGADASEFLMAYFALVLMAATAEGLGNAVTNAILVSIAYAVLTRWGLPLDAFLEFRAISHFAFFFIIAVFMGHLAQEARAESLERERAKAALRVTSSELRQSTAQLKAAREALRANDRLATLGMLSAGIAHEMKNPLAAIVSSLEPATEVLEEFREETGATHTRTLDELMSILTDCGAACTQLMHVAQGLTAMARGQSGAMVPVDPAESIGCAQRMLRNRLQNGTQADFRVETRRRVMANPGRLLQVLLNLAGNAIDAMETTGGGTLTIRAEDADEDRVALVVADTGPGMTEAVHRKIFEPFFTTKPLGRGTGLGLHVVREIVTSQRGTVTCETQAGVGTTFRVELPAQPAEPESESKHVRGREDAADRGRRGDHPPGTGSDVPQGALSTPARV